MMLYEISVELGMFTFSGIRKRNCEIYFVMLARKLGNLEILRAKFGRSKYSLQIQRFYFRLYEQRQRH